MTNSTVLQDNRIKMLIVMLPGLALAMWIASEVASDDYLIPDLILGAVGTVMVFSVFLRTVRLEAAVMCLLLAGYLIGNRGFAEISPLRPLFPGEMTMIVIGCCLLMRFALTRELPNFSGWMARTILIFCGMGAIRLCFDWQVYAIDAIRDAAMVYYSLFFFFGRELEVRPKSRALLERCLTFSFLALTPIAVIERVAPDMLMNVTVGGLNPLFQKDDLLTTFAAVAVFFLYTRPRLFRRNWLRVSLILFYLIFVVSGVGRASLAALVFGSVLLFAAGQKRFIIYPALGVFVGLILLACYASGYGESPDSPVSTFVDKLESMVDVSGKSNYGSQYGEEKAMNNEFRRQLWQSFVEETTSVSPGFGRGFGYDFISHFESTFQRGGWEGLRAAHNFYVTIFGRMGFVGLFLFVAITAQTVVGGLQAARLVSKGLYPLEDLGYWCGSWAILISSAVGVVLEGPVGAIVFWAFLGVATQCSQNVRATLAAARAEELENAPVPTLPAPGRRPVSYGAA